MNSMRTLIQPRWVAFVVLAALSAEAGVEQYLGRWALELPGGAGWLEVRQEPGYLDADLLWYGGSVTPVGNVCLDGEELLVDQVMPTEHPAAAAGGAPRTLQRVRRMVLRAEGDDGLRGTASTPRSDGLGMEVMAFTAARIPALPAPPDLAQLRFGEPVSLFNGHDLEGWTVTSPGAGNGWVARQGVLSNDPAAIGKEHSSNLCTADSFGDFRLSLEVNVPERSNSGVYLRGVYEVQITDSYGRAVNSHNMGAIYSRIAPVAAAERPAGQWQTLEVTLCQRHVTVVLNGQTIIDNQPLYGVTGGAMWADESRPGPILLQGDHGPVSYRNILLRPILD